MALIEQLVTQAHAFFKSSFKETFASLGPEVPLPLGFSLILIGLSVYLLICATVSSVQFGLSRYSFIPRLLGQTNMCSPFKVGAFIFTT